MKTYTGMLLIKQQAIRTQTGVQVHLHKLNFYTSQRYGHHHTTAALSPEKEPQKPTE
jgi:hypothetical protein